ncbi:hypothetical protein QJS10_CPA03g00213 [Acorus calamus]|uniref:Trichome birefringence-like N-terminal domain-containing protein n=1 Tax=Acorus calamus TaxID=4465 RepID=A0AAV9F7D5_ACOCL|nr:hypothetical protein QJS10_CPA03g00213 [Acorus calamus]
MVKGEMSPDWTPWSLHKHNHVLIKFAIMILLMGLSFRLLFSHSGVFAPISDSPSAADPSMISSDYLAGLGFARKREKCDLFVGEWIPNPSGPHYTNDTCTIVEPHQNCMKNGRPDTGYLYWKWKPRDCDLPMFNGKEFLETMRNKAWALIGDSISRNHVQSLVCLLSKVEQAVEIYHDKEYRSKTWRFPSYEFTLSVIWSPFLVQADIFEDMNGVSSKDIQLHLDTLDNKWTRQFHKYDYIIIAGGKWFLKTAIYYEKRRIIGCHYCPGKNITEVGFEFAYKKALHLVLHHIISTKYKGVVFLRTSTPDHFENGEWWSGGTCNRTVPFRDGQMDLRDVDRVMRDIELEVFGEAVSFGSKKGMKMRLLDTTHISLMRPDGHPGPYRQFQPFAKNKTAKVQNDCLHWCLPGPIDSWSDVVMEMLRRG